MFAIDFTSVLFVSITDRSMGDFSFSDFGKFHSLNENCFWMKSNTWMITNSRKFYITVAHFVNIDSQRKIMLMGALPLFSFFQLCRGCQFLLHDCPLLTSCQSHKTSWPSSLTFRQNKLECWSTKNIFAVVWSTWRLSPQWRFCLTDRY